MSIAITDAITTIAEAERRFGLMRVEDEAFFPEWWGNLPGLSDGRKKKKNTKIKLKKEKDLKKKKNRKKKKKNK